MTEGYGDDFFDDHKLSASPTTTASSLSTSPRGRGNATFGAAAAAGGGGSTNKKKNRRRKNNSFKKDINANNSPNHGSQQLQHHPQPNNPHGKKKNNNNNSSSSNHHSTSRSNSPKRSRSPKANYKSKHHNANCNDLHHHYNPKKDGPPDITVVVNRVDLYDSAAHIVAVAVDGPNHQHVAPPYPVMTYSFDENHANVTKLNNRKFSHCLVAIQRVPYSVKYVPCEDLLATHQTVPLPERAQSIPAVDNSIPNPFDKSIDKYWAQRRRLFCKFDQGIQLDSEGWYSVTPEIIADHVAHRIADLHAATSASQGWVVLDAFCGCGGNGIAFSKIPPDRIALTVCVDTDRNKLRMAAHNASLYNIPPDQIVFVECNSIFILKHCYRNGQFILDQPDLLIEAGATPPRLPSPVPTEVYEGYHIGGINMLPRRIDVVFMDPPWGGVDYEVLGKNGYDLEKNMKIRCQICLEPDEKDTIQDNFFDSFSPQLSHKSGKALKKANFNNVLDEYISGAEMLKYAAAATATRLVLYDLPRNANKTSLGQSALAAGYRGNLKLEEHFLNGRLKTVTAYFGTDFSRLLDTDNDASLHQPASSRHATQIPREEEAAWSPSLLDVAPSSQEVEGAPCSTEFETSPSAHDIDSDPSSHEGKDAQANERYSD